MANTQRYFTSSYFSSKLLTTSKTRENHYHCLPEELVLQSTYAGNFEIFESLFHTLANSSAATLVGSHPANTFLVFEYSCYEHKVLHQRDKRSASKAASISLEIDTYLVSSSFFSCVECGEIESMLDVWLKYIIIDGRGGEVPDTVSKSPPNTKNASCFVRSFLLGLSALKNAVEQPPLTTMVAE